MRNSACNKTKKSGSYDGIGCFGVWLCCQLYSVMHENFSSETSNVLWRHEKKKTIQALIHIPGWGVWAPLERFPTQPVVARVLLLLGMAFTWIFFRFRSFKFQLWSSNMKWKIKSTQTHTSLSVERAAAVHYAKLHKKHLNKKLINGKWRSIEALASFFPISHSRPSNAFSSSSFHFPSIFQTSCDFSSRVLFSHSDWLEFLSHTIHIHAHNRQILGRLYRMFRREEKREAKKKFILLSWLLCDSISVQRRLPKTVNQSHDQRI